MEQIEKVVAQDCENESQVLRSCIRMQTDGGLLLSLPQHAQVGRSRVYIQLPVTISIHSGGAHPNTAYCSFGDQLGICLFFAAFCSCFLEYL